MADLPQNTMYSQPPKSGIAEAIRANLQLAKTLPPRGMRQRNRAPAAPMQSPLTVPDAPMQSPANRASNALSMLKSLGTETTPYGGSTKYEKFHPGVDIAAPIGTPIPTTVGGRVIEQMSGKKQGDAGYGNYVIIQDMAGNKYRYSHLSRDYVRLGQYVPRGTILGAMGASGQTYSVSGGTGSHLDLRIRDAFGRYQNPYNFLAKL